MRLNRAGLEALSGSRQGEGVENQPGAATSTWRRLAVRPNWIHSARSRSPHHLISALGVSLVGLQCRAALPMSSWTSAFKRFTPSGQDSSAVDPGAPAASAQPLVLPPPHCRCRRHRPTTAALSAGPSPQSSPQRPTHSPRGSNEAAAAVRTQDRISSELRAVRRAALGCDRDVAALGKAVHALEQQTLLFGDLEHYLAVIEAEIAGISATLQRIQAAEAAAAAAAQAESGGAAGGAG